MARSPRPPVCESGRVYDKHLVKRMLGRGGTAEVYLAEHTVIRKEVAFKVLREVLRAEPEYVERFNGEARALGELQHPNIVRVIHAGEVAPIGPYMTMEVLEGKMLAQVLARVQLPVAVCVSTLLALASALEAVHAAAILHRDLKPENIFIATREGAPTVKLIDFASAKISKYDFEPTRIHLRPGTALYKSPEYISGGEATVRSEIYSLAMIGYEMLAGCHPFLRGADASTLDLIELHRQPKVDLREVVPQVPLEIAQVIMQSLATDPETRFASMSAFAAALRNAHSGERAVHATQALPTLRRPMTMSYQQALSVELPLGAWKTADLEAALTERSPAGVDASSAPPAEVDADDHYAQLSETETNPVPTLRRAVAKTEDVVGSIDETVIDAPAPHVPSGRPLYMAEPILQRPEEPMPATVAAPPLGTDTPNKRVVVGVVLASVVAVATAAIGLWLYFG